MHRTTIMLPPELHRRAAKVASERGLSLGELIRKLLEAETRDDDGEDALFADARTFAGPPDLAARHDEELYGGEPPALLKAGERRARYSAAARRRRSR